MFNRALNQIPKRAEQRQAERLRETFSDSGVAISLEAQDHQVIYGRRGTGKTHALRYFESECRARGDLALYVDLRTIGSPEGLFMGERVSPTEKAGRLLVDLLGFIHESIFAVAVSDDELVTDENFVSSLDALADSISTVKIEGEVETEEEAEQSGTDSSSFELGLSNFLKPAPSAKINASSELGSRNSSRKTRRGTERIALNFREVAAALRKVSESLESRRLWILLDEWGSVPADVQPLLGEFLVRCVLPLQKVTVKIAAIEQQTNFRARLEDGQTVGIELGADVSANVNLDEFMVYEQHEERSYEFFRSLFFKHLTHGQSPEVRFDELDEEADIVRVGFTDKRAFEELVRAAEGVPRDAINIAAKAAMRASSDRISVNDIRSAARTWFQSDKEAALRGVPEAKRLLEWVIDQVIREKRARGFLVNQRDSEFDLLQGLFEARVLHVVRRGYSAQDEPGERYDVWVIDYGAYVDLIHTKNEPQPLLFLFHKDEINLPEVPNQDLRAIRRAVLNLREFEASGELGR